MSPMIYEFPDPELADENGIVCAGGPINTESLAAAYEKGIFPWPHSFEEESVLLWFSPPERGVIPLDQLHVLKRVLKELKQVVRENRYSITVNQAFKEVIQYCGQIPRSGETGTWITEELLQAYVDFHQQGRAYSVECWRGEELVGGLYGVCQGSFISAESMFHQESSTSKYCLVALCRFLEKDTSLKQLDIQMVTPASAQFGGQYQQRKVFLKSLEAKGGSVIAWPTNLNVYLRADQD